MAKSSSRFVCQECGAVYPKWAGKCEACDAWNTLVEEVVEASAPKAMKPGGGRRLTFFELAGETRDSPRRLTGMREFDRVLGGGLVPGSATLIGGDPGIGKSTVLLQVVAGLAGSARCVYVSGEEAVDQVRLRARRLGVASAPVGIASATSVRDIVASIEAADGPDVVVIDSIQTMFVDALDSAPGTVAQVRASAQELIRVTKRRGIALLLVGHVTKERTIAGPRVLEHLVDTVLYFEGERGHQFRILRGVKNRFGPTDEIGVFEMTERGLVEVGNPSALFLADRQDDVSGACVFAGMEGTRPILVEIQALVAPSPFGTPRRAVVGWDSNRLAMVTAVLEARCGVSLAGNDVFLNVAGGLRVSEPAADLAVAAALVSSLTGVPVPKGAVVFGEIGLAAELRAVAHAETRLKEAAKLGFSKALLPAARRKGARPPAGGLELVEIARLHDLVELLHDPADDARFGRRVVSG